MYKSEEKIRKKWYPFCVKDKFQKYPFLPKILFLTPLTSHLRYAPSCEKSTLFTLFFLRMCTLLYLSGPPRKGMLKVQNEHSFQRKKIFTVSNKS